MPTLTPMQPAHDCVVSEDPKTASCCFHGGAFFEAIGDDFTHLKRRRDIINADVLDAWFPPAPAVIESLKNELPWLLHTSPPVRCSGLVRRIADTRHVPTQCILPGAGSSDLIYRTFLNWLTPTSRVLLLDPCYGEYAHILEHVIGCQVERLSLSHDDHFELHPQILMDRIQNAYDLVVLVNPNNPTGRHLPKEALEPILHRLPSPTRVWIDETYVDYAGSDQTLEGFASRNRHVVVCKSMSKVYALSGARVAYLCGHSQQIEPLQRITPPWVVGLPSQVAAIRALEDIGYYERRWNETHKLRDDLSQSLENLGLNILPGIINSLLVQITHHTLDATELTSRCRNDNLFIRDVSGMETFKERRHFRIAVKDPDTNDKMIQILDKVLVKG